MFHFCPQEAAAILAALPFLKIGYDKVKLMVCAVCSQKNQETCAHQETEVDDEGITGSNPPKN